MFSPRTSDIPMLFYPSSEQLMMERIWKPSIEVAPNCPRCASTKTKFCYYNNYSLSQPRYFCKGCRRYWTKGGSLRNVPLGGGCRKSRRSKSAQNGEPRHVTSSSHGGSIDESQDDINAAEIDLAAVFAKYLNPDDANNDQKDTSSGASSTTSTSSGSSFKSSFSPESEEQFENGYFECQNPMESNDLLPLGDDQQRLVQNSQVSDDIQNVSDLLEFRSILGGAETSHYQDLSDNSDLPNLAWQHPPMIQLEDFGSFSMEDHLNMPGQAHLGSVNWSSFDFSSGFEILPTLS